MSESVDPVRSSYNTAGVVHLFDLTGKTLGKYRLVAKLGQGGMAQVYKAYQPELNRYVAVKVLHPQLTGDEAFQVRFQYEARAVAALEHPNIVRVYDFETAGDIAFLVMEYLEGVSLKARLHTLSCQNERMSLTEVGRIIGAMAEALDYAHQHHVIHRDVKPSNILITNDGRPVLTDFGIARMLDATVISGSGSTLGTPAYMSPEQGQGAPGDARSDVYALGIILYQLCTGQLPFDADTPYALILKHISAPLPSPHSVRPDLPEAVERVILKALAKNPDDRFQTAGELDAALRAARAPNRAVPPPSRPRKLSRRVGLSATIGAAIVALAAFLFILRAWEKSPFSAPPTPTRTIPGSAATVSLQGADVVQDAWLDPDTPDENWHETDRVHLQGPLTPDRVLLRFNLDNLPKNVKVISATLTLRTELWGAESFPGAAVAYQVLTPWQENAATYNAPWTRPGLAAGYDFDSTPLDMIPVPDNGALTFHVTRAVQAWQSGKPNYGLVVMMSADSHNQAHHWVSLTEQSDSTDRPTLRITYEAVP